MKSLVEVTFTPADFDNLSGRDLNHACCVVFDVLRATSSIVTALFNGASSVQPVGTIPEALAARQQRANVLLAGERDGYLIGSALTGGKPFDFGNSPREFTRDKVAGSSIVMTTTNGTRALQAASRAPTVYACSFLNLRTTADRIVQIRPEELIIVCSGTFEQASYEDVLGAGALCDLLWPNIAPAALADSALIARELYLLAQNDLPSALARSRNGRRLLSRPELRADVEFCAQRDGASIAAKLGADGAVRSET